MALVQTEAKTDAAAKPFPGARAALVLLLSINLFNYLDRQVLAAVVDPIKQTLFGPQSGATASGFLGTLQAWCRDYLGFKPELALIGVLSMAFMVTYMIGAPLFGKLAERRSRWALIGVGVILWSLASGASGLAGTFFMLLLTRCLVGIGEAAYGPVAPAIISDFYPAKVRGRVLSWFYLAIPVGSALGYVLGGAVSRSAIGEWGNQWLGIEAESWRWAFYLVVIPGLVLGVISFWMREAPRGQADFVQAQPPRKVCARDYLTLLRTPSYVLCTLGMTAMTFAIGGIAFWMPYYLKHRPGAEGPVEVVFGGITCVAGLLGTLAGGMLGDKLRRIIPGSYFLVSGVAMLVGFPLMLLVLRAPFPTIWILLFFTCFCLFFNTGPTNTILANVTHPALRTTGFALNILVIHALGDVISPVIIGIVSDKHGMDTAFTLVGCMFVVAGIFWLFGIKFLKRDTELAPTRMEAGDTSATTT
ncbi:MAG TPA: MFS transporter [Clostridia bacterium]|nr:MFS transporter [Clostridia bacterium]